MVSQKKRVLGICEHLMEKSLTKYEIVYKSFRKFFHAKNFDDILKSKAEMSEIH